MGGQTPTSYTRDPISEHLDNGARSLLERVYAARGAWVTTRLADPGPLLQVWAEGIGIDLWGPDNAPTRSGKRQDAHTRYGRAFVRALWYNHRWFGGPRLRRVPRSVPYARPLELDWGRRVSVLGVIPAGRMVSVRVRPGGAQPRRAVARLPEIDRIYAGSGKPAGRHAEAAGRDWAGALCGQPPASSSCCAATCATSRNQ